MVFGTGGRPILPDDYGEVRGEDEVDEILKLREQVRKLEKEIIDLRKQLKFAKNISMLYENPDYGRSD